MRVGLFIENGLLETNYAGTSSMLVHVEVRLF